MRLKKMKLFRGVTAGILVALVACGSFLGKSNADELRTSQLDLRINHQISVLSQNLRTENVRDDGWQNLIKRRAPRLRKQLNRYDADIRCFQECSPEWKEKLDDLMSSYEYECVYALTNKNLCNPIYVKKSEVDIIDFGSYRLSERSSSKSDESRVASWVKVRDKASLKTLVVVNAHLGLTPKIQQDSCARIMSDPTLTTADGYLICGDFNFSMQSNATAYNIMKQNGTKDLAISAKTEGIQGITGHTFQKFGKAGQDACRIDFFFGSSNVQSRLYTMINDLYFGQYVSDHYGILTYIDIQ
jgi:endonuclease/exonuclease/phosphatase family metal-dependent hydrolase